MSSIPSPPFERVWSHSLSGSVRAQVIEDGTVYAATTEEISAIRIVDGQVRWSRRTGRFNSEDAWVVLTPELLVESRGGKKPVVRAFDRKTGRRVWQARVSHGSPIAYRDGVLYSNWRNKGFVALDIRTRRPLWVSGVRAQAKYFPFVHLFDTVIILHTTDDCICALDRLTGQLQWQNDRLSLRIKARDSNTLISPTSEHLVAVDADTGSELWKILLPNEYHLPDQMDRLLLCEEGVFVAYRARDLAREWSVPFEEILEQEIPRISRNERLVVSLEGGTIIDNLMPTLYDAQGEPVWRTAQLSFLKPLAVHEGTLLAEHRGRLLGYRTTDIPLSRRPITNRIATAKELVENVGHLDWEEMTLLLELRQEAFLPAVAAARKEESLHRNHALWQAIRILMTPRETDYMCWLAQQYPPNTDLYDNLLLCLYCKGDPEKTLPFAVQQIEEHRKSSRVLSSVQRFFPAIVDASDPLFYEAILRVFNDPQTDGWLRSELRLLLPQLSEEAVNMLIDRRNQKPLNLDNWKGATRGAAMDIDFALEAVYDLFEEGEAGTRFEFHFPAGVTPFAIRRTSGDYTTERGAMDKGEAYGIRWLSIEKGIEYQDIEFPVGQELEISFGIYFGPTAGSGADVRVKKFRRGWLAIEKKMGWIS